MVHWLQSLFNKVSNQPAQEAVPETAAPPPRYQRPLDESDRELLKRVQSLESAGRYRSAIEAIFPVLDLDPHNQWALDLAATVLYSAQSRANAYKASEPFTDEFWLDARLDSLFCECERCHSTWVPMLVAALYSTISTLNAAGGYCRSCNKVFCRNCLEESRLAMGVSLANCPACGGQVASVTRPTGRRPRQTGKRMARLEVIAVFREGPVPPDHEYLERLFRKITPEVSVDSPHIIAMPLFPWPQDQQELQRQATANLIAQGINPAPERTDFYFFNAPDEEGNYVCIAKVYGEADKYQDPLYETNLQELTRLVERHPESVRVRAALAARYLMEGRYDSAFEQGKIALQLDPSHGQYDMVPSDVLKKFQDANELMREGSQLLQAQKFEAAKGVYRKLLEAAPNWSVAWNELGLCDFYLRFFASANESLNHALTLNPNSPPAHCNKGLVHLWSGDYAAAIEYTQKALDLRPDYPEARENLEMAKRLRQEILKHRKQHKDAGEPVINEWPMFRGSTLRAGAVSSGPCPPLRPYWQFPCDIVDSSPAVGQGRVYFGTQSGTLHCLDAFGQKEYWQFAADDSIISSPALANGYVYFGAEDGQVYCLNAISGERYWDFSTEDGIKSSPAVAEGQVYIGSLDSHVYCLDAAGNLLWKFNTGSPVLSSPAVGRHSVYVSSDGKLYCLSKGTGVVTWSFERGSDEGNILAVTPTLDDSRVYIAGGFPSTAKQEGRVCCLDSSTGKLEWSYTWPGGEAGFQSSLAVADGVVYIGGLDGVFLGVADGFQRWIADPDLLSHWWILSSPTVVGNYVYLSVNDGMLYCFDRVTGMAVWSFRIDPESQGASSSPAIAYNRLYIGTSKSGLLCFGEDIGDWIG